MDFGSTRGLWPFAGQWMLPRLSNADGPVRLPRWSLELPAAVLANVRRRFEAQRKARIGNKFGILAAPRPGGTFFDSSPARQGIPAGLTRPSRSDEQPACRRTTKKFEMASWQLALR